MTILLILFRILTQIAFGQSDFGDADATLEVTLGSESSVMEIITSISTVLVRGIVAITAAIVTIGGLMIAGAHGDDSWVENGKKAVIGGLTGFAVVMGSYGIMRMLLSFIYF